MPSPVFPILFMGSFGCLMAAAALWGLGGWETFGPTIRTILAVGLCAPLVGCAVGASQHAITTLGLGLEPEQRRISTNPELRISARRAPAQGGAMLWRALAVHGALIAAITGLVYGHHALSQGGVATVLGGLASLGGWALIVLPTLPRTWALVRHPLDPSWTDQIDRCACMAAAALLSSTDTGAQGQAKIEVSWNWAPTGYTAKRGEILLGTGALLSHRSHTPQPTLFLPRDSVAPGASNGQWQAFGQLWPFLHLRSRDLELGSAHARMGLLQTLWAHAGAPNTPRIGMAHVQVDAGRPPPA
jgi:hypothetical protein